MVRRFIYFLLVSIVLGGLGALIAFYAFEFKPKMLAEAILGSPQPAQTVSAEAARDDSWQPTISGIGTLNASEGINIAPQVGGVVREVNFDSGQDVKAGTLLVKLDTETEEAEIRSLQAQLDNALSDLDRKEKLAAKGISAPSELDALIMLRDRFKANIEKERAVIAQKSIFAPWDGRLGLREVSLGSYLAAGQTIVWLQKVDPIYADFQVSEEDFGRIRDGLKVEAEFSAYPGEKFDGEIITRDARVSDANRMITVRAKISNPDGKLVPGMYANVKVETGAPEKVVTVPQTAVTFSLYGDSVFVVVPATKLDPKAKPEELAVERRFVKAGAMRDTRIEIVSGVKAGEQVVTAGHNKIDQGSKVLIDNSIALKPADGTAIQ